MSSRKNRKVRKFDLEKFSFRLKRPDRPFSQNELPGFFSWLEKFCIEIYCEFFKIAFSKILAFLRRLKTRLKLPYDICND